MESGPGRGTCFVLRFQVDPGPAPTGPVMGSRPVRNRQVLVVDDDRTIRRLLGSLLRAAGHTVFELDTAESALRLVEERKVDLVCTDARMPGMTGLQLAAAIRAAGHPVQIVLFTGWDEEAAEARAAGTGDLVMHKPINFERLLRSVVELMESKDGRPNGRQ